MMTARANARRAVGWSGDAKALKKHEKQCDFVKDPTRRACKNNCGFYGLLDATARHEVNCDFVDPKDREAFGQRESSEERVEGCSSTEIEGPFTQRAKLRRRRRSRTPISETTTYKPRRRWSHAFAGRHANDRGGTDQIVVLSKVLP